MALDLENCNSAFILVNPKKAASGLNKSCDKIAGELHSVSLGNIIPFDMNLRQPYDTVVSPTKEETMDCEFILTLLKSNVDIDTLEEEEAEEVSIHLCECRRCSNLFSEHLKHRVGVWINAHKPLFSSYVEQIQQFIAKSSEARQLIRRANIIRPNPERGAKLATEVAHELVTRRMNTHNEPNTAIDDVSISSAIDDMLSEWVRSGHA